MKNILDILSLGQRQRSKELESQWTQLKLVIEPAAESICSITKQKMHEQKEENQVFLKQLLSLKKQHGTIKEGIEELRKQVRDMIKEIG